MEQNLEKISEIAKKGELNTIFSNKEKNNKIDYLDKKLQSIDNKMKEQEYQSKLDANANKNPNAINTSKIGNNSCNSKIIFEFNDKSLNAQKFVDQSQFNKNDSDSYLNKMNHPIHSSYDKI